MRKDRQVRNHRPGPSPSLNGSARFAPGNSAQLQDPKIEEQPSLHYLYREIANASAAFDRAELRKRLFAIATRPADVLRGLSMPTLFITGGEDMNYPPFLSEALAPMMPNAKVEQVPEAGHSVYFQRTEIYNRLVGDFLLRVG